MGRIPAESFHKEGNEIFTRFSSNKVMYRLGFRELDKEGLFACGITVESKGKASGKIFYLQGSEQAGFSFITGQTIPEGIQANESELSIVIAKIIEAYHSIPQLNRPDYLKRSRK